ncbi:MAG: hypothetical protein AAF533_08520 [Acidobacteriota bacterium]
MIHRLLAVAVFVTHATLALAGDGQHVHGPGCKGHHHEAPHGGTLVAFGDEFAHLELVLDSELGEMTLYFLDGSADRGVWIAQHAVALSFEVEGREPFHLAVTSVPNVLTGESLGNSSVFSGTSAELKGLTKADITLSHVMIRGVRFDKVKFPFPEGNEGHGHDHAGD